MPVRVPPYTSCFHHSGVLHKVVPLLPVVSIRVPPYNWCLHQSARLNQLSPSVCPRTPGVPVRNYFFQYMQSFFILHVNVELYMLMTLIIFYCAFLALVNGVKFWPLKCFAFIIWSTRFVVWTLISVPFFSLEALYLLSFLHT